MTNDSMSSAGTIAFFFVNRRAVLSALSVLAILARLLILSSIFSLDSSSSSSHKSSSSSSRSLIQCCFLASSSDGTGVMSTAAESIGRGVVGDDDDCGVVLNKVFATASSGVIVVCFKGMVRCCSEG